MQHIHITKNKHKTHTNNEHTIHIKIRKENEQLQTHRQTPTTN